MFKHILKDKYLRFALLVTIAVFLFTLVFTIISFSGASGSLVIHFDAFKGIDFVGTKTQVFGIMAVGFVILLINFLLAEFIYRRERFFAYAIVFSSLILSILLLIVISVINSVN